MRTSRRIGCATALILVGLVSAVSASELTRAPARFQASQRTTYPEVELRGFGRTGGEAATWSCPDGRRLRITRLRCQSARHATVVLSKFLADLDSWQTAPGVEVTWDGRDVSLRTLGEYGMLLAAVVKRDAWFIGARRPDVIHLAVRHLGIAPAQLLTTPAISHPKWLDAYQRYAIQSFHQPLVLFNRDHPLTRPFEFAGEHGVGVMPSGCWGHFEIENGLFDHAQLDWTRRQSLRYGVALTLPILTHIAPPWLVNAHPEYMIARDPQVHLGTWGWGAVFNQHVSPDRPEAYAYANRYVLDLIDQVRESPWLTAYYVGDGWPGAEIAYHGFDTIHTDYSENGRRSFRRFLKDKRKLTLQALGERWHGDPKRFGTWADVHLPHWSEGMGFGPDAVDIDGPWRRCLIASAKPAPKDWFAPKFDDSDWDLFPHRADVQNLLFPPGPKRGKHPGAWFRAKCELSPAWLKRARGQAPGEVFLCLHLWQRRPDAKLDTPVYVNGRRVTGLHLIGAEGRALNVAANVTASVREGTNLIALEAPRGYLFGPVFLRAGMPRRYPYLGRGLNCRWRDFRDWQEWYMTIGQERVMKAIRSVDPNRPITISGPYLNFSRFTELFRDYGANGEFTGSPGWFFPWQKGYGYVYGRQASCEEGGTCNDIPAQKKQWGWMLTMALGRYYQYWNTECMYSQPGRREFFVHNRRMFRALGKFDWAKPSLALLRSALAHRYYTNVRPNPVWHWDLGRGELQSLGVNNVYLTETEITSGKAKEYPVLWDCGTPMMGPGLVDALADYVRSGGTFVAIHQTGRHGLDEPDAWPITKLTGFQVVGQRRADRVTFTKSQTLLPRLRARSFPGAGTVIDWMDDDRTGAGTALKPGTKDVEIVATWQDGTCAIGTRRLGRGRVVVLGTTFWRRARDIAGTYRQPDKRTDVLSELLDAVGVKRRIRHDDPTIWASDCITNDGRDRWITLFNTSAKEKRTFALRIACDRRPDQVRDVLSEDLLTFTYTKGTVTLDKVAMAPLQSRILAIRRAGLGDAVDHWFRYQRRTWDALPAQPKLQRLPAAESLDLFRGWRFRLESTATSEKESAWTRRGFDDSKWRRLDLGIWQAQGVRGQGFGRYRRTFTVPPRWKGKRVFLWCGGYEWLLWWRQGRLWLNGQMLFDWDRGWTRLDVTDRLQPGENLLAFEVDGNDKRRLSGMVGTIGLYTRPHWATRHELRGLAVPYDKQHRPMKPVPMPGTFSGRCLVVDFTVPASWHGNRVWLSVETGVHRSWVLGAILNNAAVSRYHPTGNLFEWMISPHLKSGEARNRLVLFSLSGLGGHMEKNLPVRAINLMTERPATGVPQLLPAVK